MHLASALLLAALAASPQDPPARDPGTWILMIEGDANGLAVTRAAAKPFPYREPRASSSEWRIVLLDKNGKVIAAPPLDFSPFCMEHAHVGQGPHVTGDYSREHKVVFTVKVPARADIATIRIEHEERGKAREVLGSIDRDALVDLVKKSAEKRK